METETNKTVKMYIINTFSHMHVGSGEINFGLVDRLIQKDPVTTLPVIHASGLKGGIRERFKKEDFVEYIFGNDPKDLKKNIAGNIRFFDANLLSMPVRCNKVPYLMATSVHIIRDFIRKIDFFGYALNDADRQVFDRLAQQMEKRFKSNTAPAVFDSNLKNALIEDLSATTECVPFEGIEKIKKLFGEPLVILPDRSFASLCDDEHLPIIARNNLNDGQSANLWYEQVLPRYSRLYFPIIHACPEQQSELIKKFEKQLTGNYLQLGANASIGYGFCNIQELSEQIK